jgi:hypothetical protein
MAAHTITGIILLMGVALSFLAAVAMVASAVIALSRQRLTPARPSKKAERQAIRFLSPKFRAAR